MTYDEFIVQLMLLGWTKLDKNHYVYKGSIVLITPRHFYHNPNKGVISVEASYQLYDMKHYTYDKAMENIVGIMDHGS